MMSKASSFLFAFVALQAAWLQPGSPNLSDDRAYGLWLWFLDGSRELGVSGSQLALGAVHCLGFIGRQCTVLTTAIDEMCMP